MNNNTLKNVALKILDKSQISSEEKFGSVVALLMVISIILTLVRILQECNKNKLHQGYSQADKYNLYGSEIKEYSVRRGWFTKMRIKKLLRRELSPEQYEKYSLKLVNAILDTGEKLSNEEVMSLVDNANV